MIFPPDLASEMTDVPLSTLRRWSSLGVVTPSLRNRPGVRNGRWFSEDDLYLIAVVAELGHRGVPLQRRKAAVQCLRASFERGQQAERLALEVTSENVAVVSREPSNGSRGEDRSRIDLRPIVDHVQERIRQRQERVGLHGKITRTRGVQGGRPVLAGTRIPVEDIKHLIDAGFDYQWIMEQYPGVSELDLDAAASFDPSLHLAVTVH
jgi:uncharacterized protein (DUF433 family)